MPGYPYIDIDRIEMVAFVPDTASRVLDVGCGYGGFGAALKARRRGVTVWGIESSAEVGARAGDRLDRLIVGSYPDDVPAGENFDCIVFNDVLEHVVDPWATLRDTHRHLTTAGCVVASIPNVRHWSVVWSLLRAGTWTYRDSGILDRTHLRFFTRSSMSDLFAETGYRVERLQPITFSTRGRTGAIVARFGRRTEAFRTVQYGVRAVPIEGVAT